MLKGINDMKTSPRKTSKNWMKLPKYAGITIYDPDGWNRQNYDYSFDKQRITWREFERRLSLSTRTLGTNEHKEILNGGDIC